MPASTVSAFTSYSTVPTWVSNPRLVRIEPTDDTPFPTFVEEESWDLLPEMPDYCTAIWMIHREGQFIGPKWYIFRNSSCPEAEAAAHMYDEFDDWEYIPKSTGEWHEPGNPCYTPANLLAREDPIAFMAHTYLDPNDWVNDVQAAIHMEIWTNSSPPSWGDDFDDRQKSQPLGSMRWGKPNRHVRRKMGPEWTAEQEAGWNWDWRLEGVQVEWETEWHVEESDNAWI